MKRIYKYSLVIGGALSLLSGCHRRPLEDGYIEKALIPIGAVWNKAGIMPQNTTALFYNQSNGKLVLEHRFENNNNRIQTYADVPVGTYTVVLFNEIRDQIRGVGIRGYENLATLEAYAIPNPNPTLLSRADKDAYVYEPDILASVTVQDFEVTCDMVTHTHTPGGSAANPGMEAQIQTLVGLIPERKVHEFKIIAHVQGLKNARMPALADLHGMAESYEFTAGKSSLLAVTQQFTMNNRTYDAGSNQHGTISTTIHTFGILGEVPDATAQQQTYPVVMDFFFLLVDADKTLVHQQVNVTNLIRFLPQQHGATTLDLYVNLPEALHNVDPQGEGSGFNTELIDWETIDIPLNAK